MYQKYFLTNPKIPPAYYPSSYVYCPGYPGAAYSPGFYPVYLGPYPGIKCTGIASKLFL